MKDQRVKVSIEIDVVSDWLVGPGIQHIANSIRQMANELAYADIYKRSFGEFNLRLNPRDLNDEGIVVGKFTITEEN